MRKNRSLILGISLFLFPCIVFADAGVPMVFLGFPFMLAVFIPVCALEIYILSRAMNLAPKFVSKPVIIANSVSTLFGYPLSWLFLLLVEEITTGGKVLQFSDFWNSVGSVTLQAAWLIPYESDLYWMVPVAGIVGLLPAYFISVWLEFLVLKKVSVKNIIFHKKDVRNANLASYAFLLLILVIILIVAILKPK